VIAAFHFVPGIAALSVVAVPDGADDAEALLDVALVDEMRRHLVLDSRPDLVGVDEWKKRPLASRPGAEKKPALVAEGEDPLRVRVRGERLLEVVAIDGANRPLHVLLGKDVAFPHDVGHPLAEQLVGQAARAHLVLLLARALIGLHVEFPIPGLGIESLAPASVEILVGRCGGVA
jgi:hypothetical protein